MKVLHVIDSLGLGGGAEHSLVQMLPLLAERGVESSVACIRPRVGGLQADLVAAGCSVTVLEGSRLASHVRSLRRLVQVVQPDLVHATLFESCLTTRLALLGTGTPSLNSLVNLAYDPVRLADQGAPGWKRAVVQRVDRITARRGATRIHALTDAVAREAIDVLGIDPQRVHVVPRGRSSATLGPVTPERRSVTRAGLAAPDDALVVLSVGRQDHQKAQLLLVEAFAQVLRTNPGAILWIAGRAGTATPHIERTITDHGIGDAVRLLGHRTDVPDLMVAADVFAFPSMYEGLGCSLVEAMALDLVIVGSDAPAIAEVLDDGACGIVVPRGDRGALASAVERLLGDPSLRATLRRAAGERFRARFELDQVADDMVEVYRQTIAVA